MKQVRVTSAIPLHDFVVSVEFSDGTQREIDLSPYLEGEIFEPIRNDAEEFRSLRVEPESRTISWENGADIDPYTLYYGLTPEWTEEDDDVADLLALRQARRENTDKPGIPLAELDRDIGLR